MFSKKNILFLLIVLVNNFCFSQDQKNRKNVFFSLEVGVLSLQYFTKYQNQLNYGFGLGISENFRPFKITTGLFYNTKKYFESYENKSTIDKITYSLDYFNVPILISFPLIKQEIEKNQFLIATGIVFNIPYNYHSITYYKNSNPPITNGTQIEYKTGSSFRLAFQFHRKLNDIFNICTGVFGDYKFQLDQLNFNNSTPHWHPTYSDDRFLVGVNVSIEWVYKKR